MKLGQVCDVVRGSSPRPKDDSRFYGGTVPRLMVADLTRDGKVVSARIDSLTELGAKQSRPMKRGDVVIAVSGAPGLPAILAHDACIHDGFVGLRDLDRNRLDADFLYAYLTFVRSTSNSQAVGAIFKNLTTDQIRGIEIPELPLTEQRRIAEVLDRAEALRVKRRAALAQLDFLTQSLFLDLFGDPATNPKGWPKGTLGDVATFVGGGTPSRARPEFYEGSICWATSKDMKCEFLEDTQEHITKEAIEQSATNLVPAGTILIVVKSKILAHSLPVAIARVPTCFGQDLKGITTSERCDVAFVTTALRSGKRWLLERARGINTEGLTLDHLKAFPLSLPPISLQREFARRVTAVEALKTAQRASLAELDALFASLQHRAFRGEL